MTNLRKVPSRVLLFSSILGWSIGCAQAEQTRAEDGTKPASTAGAVNAPPAPLDSRVRGWELGKRHAYDLKLSTGVALSGAQNDFDFDVTAKLQVEPVVVQPESATLYAYLGDASIVSRLPASKTELDGLAAELRSSGAFFVMSGGRVIELLVPPGMSHMAAGTYRQVAAALQFARVIGDGKRYTAEEYDTTGQYVAEYALGDGGVWHKKKLRYVGLLGLEGQPGDVAQRVVPEVVESRGEVLLSESGRPVRVTLADKMEVKGAQAPVRSTLAIALHSSGGPRAMQPSPNLTELLAKCRRFGANEVIPNPKAAEVLDTAKIGGLDFETIVARLEERASGAKSDAGKPASDAPLSAEEQAKAEQEVQQDSRLFNALSATFRNDPRTTDKAVEKIKKGSSAASTLMAALGAAGTPEAHRALGKLLRKKTVDREVERRIVLSLSRTPKPTKEGALALKALLERDPLNAGALYGLGTYSRLHRDAGATEEAKALGEILVGRFDVSKGGPMSLGIVLRAIANSGYAGALPRVTPYLDHKDERVRVAAMRAVQSMRDPRVDGILAEHLRADVSPQVRLSALEAAKLREPNQELVAALTDAGTKAEDRHVRYRAVELMSDWLSKRPELRGTLELVARNDAEAKIRERAKAAL